MTDTASNAIHEYIPSDTENTYLGWGIRVEHTASDSLGLDLVFDQGPNGRQLSLVSGAENLGQDLRVALLTATGTDLFNRSFGFDGLRVLTQNLDAVLAEEMLRLSLVQTLSQDARVKEVVKLELTAIDKTRRSYLVDVEVLTVLGELENLALMELKL